MRRDTRDQIRERSHRIRHATSGPRIRREIPRGAHDLCATPIPSRTQYVLEEIKRRILTGRLTPGQALVETDLAAQFGVSKTPVREALKTLAGTGLVVMSQYKGVTVRMVGRGHGARGLRRPAAPGARGPQARRAPRASWMLPAMR